MAISIIYWLLVASSVTYFVMMFTITIGWFRLKKFEEQLAKPLIPVSVIVAVRNEETSILSLLKSILNQDYPISNIQVIIVDDHSEDGTRRLIEDFILLNDSVKINLITAQNKGKKKAMTQGISAASGQLIVTTDGDCEMGRQWLSRLVAYFQANRPSIIIAPVVYHQSNRLLKNIFALEFISLVASGAGSVGIGMPFMGNAANLAFSKEATSNIQSIEGGQYTSGDDVFFIQQVVKNKGADHVQFIKDTEAIVYTEAPGSISAFFNQRIRWASKAKGYISLWAMLVAFAVFSFNTMLVISFAVGLYQNWMLVIFGLFIVFKLLIDIPLLYEFTGFVNKRRLMLLLPFLEFIYPFYIVTSSIAGLFFSFEWKGRKGLK